MIRLLFLIPLVLSIAWFIYLRVNGWTFKQGLRGFIYIAIVSGFIALFYSLMLWLTGR
ncbi:MULTISPECIES: hypothetical protein [Idiomarinaceae]|uniref:Uncharacterized protein n=4 Tax=Pseudidiomarina TaxID=2800384 RepID=A0A368USB7_9GAMM|nr:MULTISPECIES: hypothetical protein [Idiomarinaceae]MDT7524534.1 hypothetical protein [Pseudidiomarina sp. GXY010]MDX1526470.1 hypothetical protein [Pseudidiomarina maritima]PWW11867.1 hypothetical protein DET45_11055 [Pseudidiomarina maritima]RBP88934.1 hypothetical protein DFO81_11255 [Pseudidiomarina tainanensis]RCW30920.1 hypothetical protein DFO79_11155 [Pseudidiomarina tainanensis]